MSYDLFTRPSETLKNSVRRFEKAGKLTRQGVLFVASAGNTAALDLMDSSFRKLCLVAVVDIRVMRREITLERFQ